MSDTDGTAGGGAVKDPVGSIGTWLSVVFAGLVGAFGFLGVKQEEVAVILRSESARPSLVAALIALALAASIISVFLAGARMSARYGVAVVLLAVSIFPITVRLIPTPAATSGSRLFAGVLIAAVFLLAALAALSGFFGWPKKGKDRTLPAQAVVLIVAVFLLASAVYSAMRLETRSQYNTTGAQIDGAVVTGENGGAKITLHVRTAKLGSNDDVGVSIYGAPREDPLNQDPAVAQRQDQSPCSVPGSTCRFVGGSHLKPDAFGNIDDTFEVPIDAAAFQHLAVTASVCLTPHKDTCDRIKVTTLDFRIPPPPPQS